MLLVAIRSTRRTALFRRPYSSNPHNFIQESFSRNVIHVLDVGRRFLRFSALGLLLVGATAATGYEAVHQYVEHVELASAVDRDLRRWEWECPDHCNWTTHPDRGGTDPSLGFRGRHAVRAAWMAYNWGVGYTTAVVDSGIKRDEGLPGPGGVRIVDAGLQRAEDFLRRAIQIAEEKRGSGSVNPCTLTDLLLCRASILERLGRSFQMESKAEYERAWALLPSQGLSAAHVAWKLGGLNSLLGQGNDALKWWSHAILLSCGKSSGEHERQVPVVPDVAPISPQAQRTLTSTLVSLSAFYAMSGKFKQARELEESALNLIRSIPVPNSIAAATPAQALHALFLLHRSSLLSIHLAEVLHAQRQPATTSFQWLTSAAESSERVAYALTGLPVDTFHNRHLALQTMNRPLLDSFKTSRTMNTSAASLLRDASRTAAEAWNLMGVLHEAKEGSTSENALQCYERAMEWASATLPQSEAKVAADGTLEADWEVIRSNYNRLRQRTGQNTSA